jgi:hypothetical protein
VKSLALASLIIPAAQALCLNSGGPVTFNDDGISTRCFQDIPFLTGTSFTFKDPLSDDPELGTLRYAPSFGYNIPGIPGFYAISLSFVDPNSITAGQRIFNVTVNGQPTQDLDLFALSGGFRKPYNMKLFAAANGFITISFKAKKGNAIINRVSVQLVNPLDLFDIAIIPDKNNIYLKQAFSKALHELKEQPQYQAPSFSGQMNPLSNDWLRQKAQNIPSTLEVSNTPEFWNIVIITKAQDTPITKEPAIVSEPPQ